MSEQAVDPNAVSAEDIGGTNTNTSAPNTTTPKPVKKVIKLDPAVKVPEKGYTLEQVAIEKPEPGFKYWTPKWGLGPESVDQDFENLVNHYGKDTIMAIVSSQARFALRSKAKFSIPDEEGEGNTKEEDATNQKIKQEAAMAKFLAEHPDGVILTQAEALEWKPGTRERTSWMSLLKQAQIAKKEGRVEDAKELFFQANELMMADFDPEDLVSSETAPANS